jgi:hypothetical protein
MFVFVAIASAVARIKIVFAAPSRARGLKQYYGQVVLGFGDAIPFGGRED